MSKMKRLLAFVVAAFLSIAVLPSNALAATNNATDTAYQVYEKARSCIKGGKYIYKNVSGSNTKPFVYLVQSYLWRYNKTCQDHLRYGNQSIDGEYGQRTYDAVWAYQVARKIGKDGQVYKETWKEIASTLYYHQIGSGYDLELFSSRDIGVAYTTCRAGDALPYLCYITQGGQNIICIDIS